VNRVRSVAMLLAVVTGLLVIMLVSVFATAAMNAYARKQDANHTLMVVRRTAEALLLRETVRVELGVVDTALQAPEFASTQTLAQITTLHAKSELGLEILTRASGQTPRLHARLVEVQNQRVVTNRMFHRAIATLRSPRDERPNNLAEDWRTAVIALLLAIDTQARDQSDTIENADSFINEMMKINELAWSMRGIAGADRRRVTAIIREARPLSAEQREGLADAGGGIGALWKQIEVSNRQHPFPPRLRTAIENARRVYIVAYQATRTRIIARLSRSQPTPLSGQAWMRLSDPGLSSIVAISKSALAITEVHAAGLARQANRHFSIAVGFMLASIILASSAMLYVMWRVIAPLKTITQIMRSIAGGDLTREIPFGQRQDEIGQFAQAVHLFRDSVVVQQDLENELLRNRSARDAAETSNRLKSEFLANMSHELRTPLNAILGFSEMIGTEILGPGLPQYRVYASDIHSAGSHLLSLINDILDLSKAEAGKLELHCERVDMVELIEECVRLVRGRAEEQDLRIRLALSELPPLFADRLRVKQILLNLLSNAIKFTPQGGQVSVDAACDTAGQLVVHVCDTGIGIAPEMIPLAFEPFRQVDSVLARRFEGTGLGLPLVKSFVTLHKGGVTIQSALGKGTTVSVSFPKSRCMEVPTERRYERNAVGA